MFGLLDAEELAKKKTQLTAKNTNQAVRKKPGLFGLEVEKQKHWNEQCEMENILWLWIYG